MAVSKRLRYEVLRRDNHTCRYCGAKAPDVRLTVDHVLAVTLGGLDDATNLVSACVDCNFGKASSNPHEPLLQDVSQDVIRWSRARVIAAAEMQKKSYIGAHVQQLLACWDEFALQFRRRRVEIPQDAYVSLRSWLTYGLPAEQLADAMESTLARPNIRDESTWRYFSGIAWAKLRELEAYARELMARDGEA